MVKYRRAKTPGGTYFFTVTLHNRQAHYLTTHINELRNAFKTIKTTYPFKTKAIVILPDHLHTIWQLPPSDDNYSLRWQRIKRLFTETLLQKKIQIPKNKLGEYELWQKRFWEHLLKDEKDLEHHTHYIHYNPVKHGLVQKAGEWPYSSLHQFIRQNLLPQGWLTVANTIKKGQYGE